jgi:hypothetical protein
VPLVGFIIRIYHDERSSECQNRVKNGGAKCKKDSSADVFNLIDVDFV